MKILIIGNGIAGLTAAEEIRKLDQLESIVMISEEKIHTYYRTKLSHFLAKDFTNEEVLVHPPEWYEEKNIQVLLNKKVLHINADLHTVELDDGSTLEYDKLLLANGSSSFVPPVKGSEQGNVFSLRSLEDAKVIQQAAKESKKAVVVGGGLLGLESANALLKLGLDVTVVEFAPRLLPRQMDEEASLVVKEIVENQGIQLLLDAQIAEIKGDPVKSCVLKNGDVIDTDMVLFSAGVRSNIQLAKDAGIETDRAVIVNEYLETSMKNIYAAGDVAEFKGMSFNIWPISMEQGKIAGQNMLGEKQTYEAITPSNMLQILNVKAFSLGDLENSTETRTLKEKDRFIKLFFQDGVLSGAILIHDISSAVTLKKAMGTDCTDLLKSTQTVPELLDGLKS
ncbi:NAD(P)/FAD-dependent oxidoreductase [Alkalibacter rhizosphaerae]|uniref:NAD(P)/FAD-dependent oxidoreductase n=1 Tax=Alkalibacter rhizosphaerae TaxID=2815577 RepID=A0A974XH07_9FIRM|nr:FAD-dependent oxidoreductase [Alkalibacter rhizosphaerae]QSX08148.1 NAD(P)/FAD-dependent oxidoreductase [Alkalibacter rhizosphaerae]